MDFLKNLVGPKQAAPGAGGSLLSDWNSYSATPDVEAGGASSSTAHLFTTVDQAGTKVSGFFQDSFKTVSTGVASGVTTLTSGETFRYSIPNAQQLVYFFSFLGGGVILLLLAFTIFLPVIILAPAKFALSFTLGCLSIMAGFGMLRGWKQQLQHMIAPDRIPFSAAYVGSIVATLYAALIMKSYLLSLLCSGLQVVALLYYLFSYFPGGSQGVKFMLNLFYQAVVQCFSGVSRTMLN